MLDIWVRLSPKEKAVLKQFGAALRRVRTGQKMTQERLAELTDLHLRTIQKFEAGDINPLLTTLKRLQAALGCDWDSLMK